MSALSDLVNPDVTITVRPVELWVNQTYSTGNESRLSLVENHDLGIGDTAQRILSGTMSGRLVIAMAVDEDHDEIHYEDHTGADAIETLKRGIELLTTALSAAEHVLAPR